MIDHKRDESMDCFVNTKCDGAPAFGWLGKALDGSDMPHYVIAYKEESTGGTRYVPHSDLVAAELKTEKLREALDMLLDEINAAPLAIHGGNGDVKRFSLALKVAREFSNAGRP